MELCGKNILVSGGSRRLGLAMAHAFADRGGRIAVTVRGGAADLRDALDRLPEGACAISADLSTVAGIDGAVPAAEAALGGPVDILINNAAAFSFDRLETVTVAGMEETFRVSLVAPVALTRDVTRHDRPAAGLIINILDYKIHNPFPDFLSYTLAKYGLAGFTQIAARQLAPRWRVCGIAPGYTLPGPEQPEAEFLSGRDAVPLLRGSRPGDIAAAALYLAESDAVTSQVLTVDGGAHMRSQERDFLFGG